MASGRVDEAKLLQIFPNEVWCLILEEVKEAPDYHKISNASPLFRTLLLPRASHIFLADVSQILMKHLPPDLTNVQGNEEAKKGGVQILKLRQVCRSSRNAVDKWLQAQDFYSRNPHEESVGWEPTVGMGYTRMFNGFRALEHFDEFEKHFDLTHLSTPTSTTQEVNPFLSRGITLDIPSHWADALLLNFALACVRLLQKYGHHLWYCRIYPNTFGARIYPHIMPIILGLMPNLRALLIHGEDGYGQAFGGLVNGFPFPRLEQLHTICVRDVANAVLWRLLRNNPQVRQVDVWGSSMLAKWSLELLPNLTAASFQVNEGYDFTILRTAEVVGHVERLWLRLPNNAGQTWERIFQLVEDKFSGSLQELELQLPGVTGDVKELTLPKLKILRLRLPDPVPLDFLLPMKDTLEQLEIDLHLGNTSRLTLHALNIREEEEESAVLKVYKFWREPVRSTVWNHFPISNFSEWLKRGAGREWKVTGAPGGRLWTQNYMLEMFRSYFCL